MSAAQFYNSAPQQESGGGDQNRGYGGGYGEGYNQQHGGWNGQQQYAGHPGGPQGNYPPPPPPNNYQGGNNGYAFTQGQNQGQGYGMKPSQPYAAPPPNQQQPPPPVNQQSAEYGNSGQVYDTAPFSQADEKTGPRFAPRKRVNDIIPLILFIAAIAGFAVLSGISIRTFIELNGLGGAVGGTPGRTGSALTLN